jgi:hypothetical protein
MAELFDNIILEIKRFNVPANSDWVDTWDDVLHDPPPHGSIGIMGTGFLDRVADAGSLTFSLNNAENNSLATLGYYSDGLGKVYPGNFVRLGFTYSGRTKYKWYGYIEKDGVRVTTSVNGERRVDISCRDWIAIAQEFPLDYLAYATNKRIDEAVALIMEQMDSFIRPISFSYNTGNYTFPTVFDLMKGETAVISEFNKLAISEMGYIYPRGNEIDGLTLVVENRLKRFNTTSDTSIPKTSAETTDLFLLADGSSKMLLADGTSRLLLTELQTITFDDNDIWQEKEPRITYAKHFANYIKTSIVPRRVDTAATTVLWNMESSVQLTAGASITGIRGRYRDPGAGADYVNGIEMVTPVANTDYKAFANADGTGTDLTANLSVTATYGTAEVDISLTNNGGTTLYTGGDIFFQVRGKGIYVYDRTDIVIDNTGLSFQKWRENLFFTMDYATNPVEIKRMLSLGLLINAGAAIYQIERYPLLANRDKKNMMAFMWLEVGSRALFKETMTSYPGVTDEGSFINGYEFDIFDGLYVQWSPAIVEWRMVPKS